MLGFQWLMQVHHVSVSNVTEDHSVVELPHITLHFYNESETELFCMK